METAGSLQTALQETPGSERRLLPAAVCAATTSRCAGSTSSALRREGEHPRPHLVLRNPGVPSLPAHLPHDPTSPPPRSHSRRVHNEFPPALPPSEDGPASPGACGAEPQRALRVAGKSKGTRARSKLTRTQPANFWAAARNARRPELSRSAEPSRGGCPGCNPPRGAAGGPASPAAPVHLYTCPTPCDRSLTPSHPATDGRAHSALPGSLWIRRCPGGDSWEARPAPAIPLGSLHRSLPTPSPVTSGKLPLERSTGAAWRAGSAPAV